MTDNRVQSREEKKGYCGEWLTGCIGDKYIHSLTSTKKVIMYREIHREVFMASKTGVTVVIIAHSKVN